MKTMKRMIALGLCLLLCAGLFSGCHKQRGISFKVIAELNQEEFCVAFRKDDPLCEIMTAAMQELSADGSISRLSAQYLGADFNCMPAVPGALNNVDTGYLSGRTLRIGVQDGVAPLSSSREDGSFSGLIPDMCALVGERLGWTFEYMAIDSDNVAAELGSGNIDCAWMAASFAESTKTCSLSPGWLRNSHQLVVRDGSGINRKNGVKGKVIGITDATALAALKESGLADKVSTIWYYDDLSSCFAALATGDCDALVIDSIVAGYYM
ncbi:MAG: transporter substrate-binding domain-containing protein [Oscillospiraceae bacterium]|nr:transporter substrate-binding domain-containing protein [Oscillospiraceae bacterium]